MRIYRYFARSLRRERKLWGPGPWQHEPDGAFFWFAGLRCAVMRSALGHWCGYVQVPEGHPWHGQDELDVDVHGGLTYTRAHGERWQLGFDCAHVHDNLPGMGFLARLSGGARRRVKRRAGWGTYKTIQYAIDETKRLAEQAREASV